MTNRKKLSSSLFAEPDSTIKQCLIKLKKIGTKCLIISNKDKKLLGTFTDGDVRSALINKIDLNQSIKNLYNKKPKYLNFKKDNLEKAKFFFLNYKIDIIPIVKNKTVIDVISWSEVFQNKPVDKKNLNNISTIIIAGGEGKRMESFSRILPKPLLPIGNKTMIEVIMENFLKIGINKFSIMTNYKSEIIKSYLSEKKIIKNIILYKEKKPLGTAGCLSLLDKKKITNNFFVTNCDIIVKEDLSKILDFHLKNKNIVTIIACNYKYQLPYGICKVKSNGRLIDIIEKPEFSYLINTGLYILNKKVLKILKLNKYLDFNHLIDNCNKKKFKIAIYPIDQESWVDIGTLSKYHENVKLI